MEAGLEAGQPARARQVEGRAGDQDQEGQAVEEVAHFFGVVLGVEVVLRGGARALVVVVVFDEGTSLGMGSAARRDAALWRKLRSVSEAAGARAVYANGCAGGGRREIKEKRT